MSDYISRQAAIDRAVSIPMFGRDVKMVAVSEIKNLPPAQPEITDEQAILHLQTSGWMQTHDKEMSEMGLREKLADDSDSYDALLPFAQPEQQIPQMRGWVCPVCGRGLSPYTSVCPCNNGKGWEITC